MSVIISKLEISMQIELILRIEFFVDVDKLTKAVGHNIYGPQLESRLQIEVL